MTKKKVLHIIQSLDNGGCENMLLRTLSLVTDFEHVLITLHKEGELSDKFKEKEFEIINIGQNGFFDLTAYFRLIKTVKKIKPDIIITYLFHADIIGRIIIQFFTKYRTIPFLRTTYNHPRYWIARLFEKITKYFVRQYLANSESVKTFYVENIGVEKEKITVIPNGIDVDFYDSLERDWDLRMGLGIENNDFVIICVSNLHINKGHKYLLEAFKQLCTSPHFQGGELKRGLKLLLVGDGSEKVNLQKQIENYQSKNNILFLGKRTDVPQLLKISDIFILPTLFEGMSNAIMEAMTCGLAVITTDIPENRILIENNINGLLVPIQNSSVLIQAIQQMRESPEMKKQLSKEAKITIQNYFSLEKITTAWKGFLIKTIK